MDNINIMSRWGKASYGGYTSVNTTYVAFQYVQN